MHFLQVGVFSIYSANTQSVSIHTAQLQIIKLVRQMTGWQ